MSQIRGSDTPVGQSTPIGESPDAPAGRPPLIDTHAHLDDSRLSGDLDGLIGRIADVLERAGRAGLRLDRWEPDAVVEAIQKSQFAGTLAVSAGPVVFNEIGDNPNASSAMIQILGQKPVVVWPKAAAEQKFVLPRPKR